jgi:hypothetical protein
MVASKGKYIHTPLRRYYPGETEKISGGGNGEPDSEVIPIFREIKGGAIDWGKKAAKLLGLSMDTYKDYDDTMGSVEDGFWDIGRKLVKSQQSSGSGSGSSSTGGLQDINEPEEIKTLSDMIPFKSQTSPKSGSGLPLKEQVTDPIDGGTTSDTPNEDDDFNSKHPAHGGSQNQAKVMGWAHGDVESMKRAGMEFKPRNIERGPDGEPMIRPRIKLGVIPEDQALPWKFENPQLAGGVTVLEKLADFMGYAMDGAKKGRDVKQGVKDGVFDIARGLVRMGEGYQGGAIEGKSVSQNLDQLPDYRDVSYQRDYVGGNKMVVAANQIKQRQDYLRNGNPNEYVGRGVCKAFVSMGGSLPGEKEFGEMTDRFVAYEGGAIGYEGNFGDDLSKLGRSIAPAFIRLGTTRGKAANDYIWDLVDELKGGAGPMRVQTLQMSPPVIQDPTPYMGRSQRLYSGISMNQPAVDQRDRAQRVFDNRLSQLTPDSELQEQVNYLWQKQEEAQQDLATRQSFANAVDPEAVAFHSTKRRRPYIGYGYSDDEDDNQWTKKQKISGGFNSQQGGQGGVRFNDATIRTNAIAPSYIVYDGKIMDNRLAPTLKREQLEAQKRQLTDRHPPIIDPQTKAILKHIQENTQDSTKNAQDNTDRLEELILNSPGFNIPKQRRHPTVKERILRQSQGQTPGVKLIKPESSKSSAQLSSAPLSSAPLSSQTPRFDRSGPWKLDQPPTTPPKYEKPANSDDEEVTTNLENIEQLVEQKSKSPVMKKAIELADGTSGAREAYITLLKKINQETQLKNLKEGTEEYSIHVKRLNTHKQAKKEMLEAYPQFALLRPRAKGYGIEEHEDDNNDHDDLENNVDLSGGFDEPVTPDVQADAVDRLRMNLPFLAQQLREKSIMPQVIKAGLSGQLMEMVQKSMMAAQPQMPYNLQEVVKHLQSPRQIRQFTDRTNEKDVPSGMMGF